ncbi:flagellin lysine-N-methylase [Shewanella frigidimarina]|uniref:flagellin lysine-N-methylase n=1 Tax=Shewanella frigidimarina TaxID=56812 RepID=UPI003D7AA487
MNQNKINVMTPKFASDFVCVGSKCEAHCCNSWDIPINKQSYKALKKFGDIEIRQLVTSNFKLTRQSESNYAEIKMSDNGDCAMLDETNLCKIHKKCGPKLLPYTCQDYPRKPHWFGNQAEMSMSLSCPEVVKNVLYDPDAMMITSIEQYEHQLNHGNIGGFKPTEGPSYLTLVRDFCFSVALNSILTFEQKLFIIGLYLKQSDAYLNNLERLSQLADSFHSMINDGTLTKHYETLPSTPSIKWSFFATQDFHLVTTQYQTQTVSFSKIKKFDAFIECQQMLMNSLHTSQDTDTQGKDNYFTVANPEREHFKYTEILTSSEKYLTEHFNQHPQILINFLLYSLYNDQLMVNLGKKPYDYFKFLTIDALMLKSYLSGIALQQKGLTKEWVVKLFHSYFRRRQHNLGLFNQINTNIKKAEEQSEYLIFSLLKD